ncbi:hypothetical protein [Stenotrophomonas sp. YIM B06876]|uniref:hypothetical protein n=1 Tax=Stenotrophomonas sp. YIM B06876 TaxID=3060211 RepID=UPI00273A05BC|nr:hypothetical protein [Stenotrophomonas sp. YIM B06876]
MTRIKAPLLALLLCLPLAACGERNSTNTAPTAPGTSPDTTVGRKVQEATDKARRELAVRNISISGEGTAKAEISPAGDLLIDGTPVIVDAAQRRLLLEYRGQVIKVAETGMDIGVQGANLGVKAAGEAIKGIFSGNTDGIEARVNEEARKIEASAQKICEQLPAMRDTQQALAASLPAFKPYARMDQSDIDECHNGHVSVR